MIAKKTKPALRESVKKSVTKSSVGGKPGQRSAVKAMKATKMYKEKGGGYSGSKSGNSLKKRQGEDWKTKSGKPSSKTGERFLPKKAIKALTPKQYKSTSDAKRKGTKEGKQFVKQPKKIASITKKYR